VPPFSIPVLGVSALIWSPLSSFTGQQVEVLFAGQAPGLVAGAVQVNLRIPGNAQTGKARIGVYVGDYSAVGVIEVR
jgi:uncharacterized protein (TIGR03437 family)